MAEIVNLRQARKRKTRDEKEKSAAANRLTFGRTSAEKQAARLEKARTDKVLEGHKRDEAE